jgi:hypothetical protein
MLKITYFYLLSEEINYLIRLINIQKLVIVVISLSMILYFFHYNIGFYCEQNYQNIYYPIILTS